MTSAAARSAAADKLTPEKKSTQLKQEMNTKRLPKSTHGNFLERGGATERNCLLQKAKGSKQSLRRRDGRSPLNRLAIRPFPSRRHVHLLMLSYGELIFLFMGLSCPPFPFTTAFVPMTTENVPVKLPINTPLTFDIPVFRVYNRQAR